MSFRRTTSANSSASCFSPSASGFCAPSRIARQITASTAVLRCPHALVGLVIGRGGETIKSIKAQTGASIHIDQNFPENVDRVITVGGSKAAVDDARRRIMEVIRAAKKGAPGVDRGDPRERRTGVAPQQPQEKKKKQEPPQQKEQKQKPVVASKSDTGPRYEKASFDKPKSFQEIMRVRRTRR